MSRKFNARGYRTVALSGKDSEEKRQEAFERLAMEETDATQEMQPLDYIFSRDILNEGVDIVEVNQVIMLRPTQSPIVFIQQLGRGLRKAPGKEYVVILDFIGNYNNNFMIPVALSGDRTYNADVIRKYVISGNSTIPGASTVHFDEISKDKIFKSIDKIKGLKTLIKESYVSLKNRLGRVPLLYDFYENQEIDPLVIIREYKTYGKDYSKMYQEKVNIEQGIRPTGELLTDRSFLMPKTTKSDKNEQPEIMKDQEEFYYGIFSERSRNFTDICDRTGSRYWNLEFNQGKGVNITVRREYSMN